MLADDLWVLRRRRSSQSRREVLRPRRAKTAISSAGRVILQTALAIVDRDGVDGLSMRRFSNAVGRDPVRLYRHVPNNAAVLDGVAKIVLAQLSVDNYRPELGRPTAHRRLPLPPVGPGTPERGAAAGHSTVGHPARAAATGVLRPLEDVLALLTSAGFTATMPSTPTGCCSATPMWSFTPGA
jgi:AcrR family transcriptional regulator